MKAAVWNVESVKQIYLAPVCKKIHLSDESGMRERQRDRERERERQRERTERKGGGGAVLKKIGYRKKKALI